MKMVFDPALMVTHLILKTVHRKGRRKEFQKIMTTFLETYLSEVRKHVDVDEGEIEEKLVRHVALLTLGRIDGIARVTDYLSSSEESLARDIALGILNSDVEDTKDLVTFVVASLER